MRHMSMDLITDKGIPISLKGGGIHLEGRMYSSRLVLEPNQSSAFFRTDTECLMITNLNVLKHIKEIKFVLSIGEVQVEGEVTLGNVGLQCEESLSLHGIMKLSGLSKSFVMGVKKALETGCYPDVKVEMATFIRVKGVNEVEYETYSRSSYSRQFGSSSTILGRGLKGRGETVKVGKDSFEASVRHFNKSVSSAEIEWKNPLDLFDSLINSLDLEGAK